MGIERQCYYAIIITALPKATIKSSENINVD